MSAVHNVRDADDAAPHHAETKAGAFHAYARRCAHRVATFRRKTAIYLSFDAMYGHPFWRQNAPLIYRSRMATKPSAPARRPRPRAIVLPEHGEVPVKLASRAKGLLERKL